MYKWYVRVSKGTEIIGTSTVPGVLYIRVLSRQKS